MKVKDLLRLACIAPISLSALSSNKGEKETASNCPQPVFYSKKADKEPASSYAQTLPNQQITPTAAPCVARSEWALFSTADFLWWKSHMEGTTYVNSGVQDDGYFTTPGVSVNQGTVKEAAYSFKPGFRVGFGGVFLVDQWDLSAQYTWLNNGTQRNSISASTNSGLLSFVDITDSFGNLTVVNASYASSSWKQSFSVVDLDLGRSFFISRRLVLRPHAGLKSAWIHDRVKYHFLPTSDYEPTVIADVKRQQNMWGLGIRTGLDTNWEFYRCWGLFANTALSGVWSDYHIHAVDWTLSSDFGGTTNGNARQTTTAITPVLEIAMGLNYTDWFGNGAVQFMAQAGWEQQVWFNFNHFVEEGYANLTFQGLTARAGFAY